MRRALVPVAEAVFPFIVVAILWEAFSLFGPFPQKLFPHVETIVATFVRPFVSSATEFFSSMLRAPCSD